MRLVAVHASSSQQSCSETITITDLQFRLVSPGTVCFQCDFGAGVATDSVFQLNNAAVGADVGTVQDGVLTVFTAENVFEATRPTTLSCTTETSSTRLTTLIFLRS